jgi:ABC-type bacteriocin/lantibiotic exporter with double-glycine peptidase domain
VALVRQHGQADCGVAALAMVIRHWQPAATVEEIRGALAFRPDDPGIEAGRLRSAARTRGLAAFLVEGTFEDLSHEVERGRPVIVGLVRRAGQKAVPHYVVVVGVNRQRQHLLTADPQHGWTEVSVSSFDSEWQPAHRLTMVVFPQDAAHESALLDRFFRGTPRTSPRYSTSTVSGWQTARNSAKSSHRAAWAASAGQSAGW